VFVMKDRKADLTHVAFSPDGQYLASAGPNVVRIYDLSARRCVAEGEQEVGDCECLSFLADGQTVITHREGVVLAQDRTTLKRLWRHPKNYGTYLFRVAVSPDRTRLVAAYTYLIKLFDLPGLGTRWKANAPEQYVVQVVTLSADNRVFAYAAHHDSVRFLDATTGARRGVLPHTADSCERALALSPDGSRLVYCAGRHLRLFTLDPVSAVNHHEISRTTLNGVAFHPSGRFFATAASDGKVDLWDAATGERRESFAWRAGRPQAVAFDDAGDRAACVTATGRVVVWDVDH
jgi:WD40 repeat protein